MKSADTNDNELHFECLNSSNPCPHCASWDMATGMLAHTEPTDKASLVRDVVIATGLPESEIIDAIQDYLEDGPMCTDTETGLVFGDGSEFAKKQG